MSDAISTKKALEIINNSLPYKLSLRRLQRLIAENEIVGTKVNATCYSLEMTNIQSYIQKKLIMQ